ncbi:FeoA family protein [Magnetospirillum fulvum]|jgi:ferrous iron transport protein A|uniref:Ferrous iron transport protein A n=1 Tax=Magnetospirillum fulvum TaxID=1082 RepID=A0A1H6I7Z4_MAGFU|nr:FeoA family protein [Magnetospirillum fulvum]SEH43026.1 ferrous iron transport protein A [Magnetospirillum fulvum]
MSYLNGNGIEPRRSTNVTVRALPLAQARAGESVRIVALRGGGREMDELAVAGLAPGRLCIVLGQLPGGATLIGFDERRLAIGGTAAAEIWVRLVAS